MKDKRVLTLLDLNIQIKGRTYFGGHNLLDKVMKQDYMDSIIDLYSKRIDAHVISELFEGWESKVGVEAHNKNNIVIFSDDEYGDYFAINGEFEQRHRTIKVNSFIYACDEFEIELNWNEEIYNKYFKI